MIVGLPWHGLVDRELSGSVRRLMFAQLEPVRPGASNLLRVDSFSSRLLTFEVLFIA